MRPAPPARAGFEPWAWAAFALVGLTVALFLFLGARPGGAAPVLAYRFGLLAAGWASAVGMLIGIAWCLRRRPVLQRGRAWPLAALAASLWFCSLPLAYPSSHEGKYSTTRFRLPFEGSARVRFGGERVAANPLLFDPERRFGLAFEGEGEALRVCAPAAGELLARVDGREGVGLVLRTGEREFCVLEGLAPEAGGLAPGARVAAGTPLGRAPGVLTMHLKDRPEPGRGEGIPLRFFGYLADGRAAESGVPVPPQSVRAPAAEVAPAAGR
jgi:hypothetical protein